MDEIERLAALIGDIYDAALDPLLWRPVLGKARGFVGGAAATIYWKDAVNKRGDVSFDFGIDPYYKKLYFEKYIKIDPLTSGQFFAGVEEPVATADVIDYQEFLDTRIYKEWAKPQGVVDFITVSLDKSLTTAPFFGVFRHERNGVVDDATRRRMRLIAPHIRRSVLIARVIDLKTAEAAAFADTLDGLSAALLLLDSQGRVVHTNASGHSLLADGSLLRVVRGRLASTDRSAERTLQEACDAAACGDAAVGVRGVSIPLIALNGDRYVAHILPLGAGARRCAGQLYTAVAAIFIHKAELEKPPAPEVIARTYKLTPTELRVLLAIVDVGGVPEVAEALGVAPNTIKTHLARVYDKTEASRQADLVKLVARFSSPLLS